MRVEYCSRCQWTVLKYYTGNWALSPFGDPLTGSLFTKGEISGGTLHKAHKIGGNVSPVGD